MWSDRSDAGLQKEKEMNARVTRRELAQRIGVVMQTITKWESAGLPVDAPGRKGKPSLYIEADVKKWLASREKDARNNGTGDVARERARKERAQAILAEQTFEIRAGELVRSSEVEQAWAAEVSAVRAKMLSWPASISDRIHSEALSERGLSGVRKVLEDAVSEALEELSRPSSKLTKTTRAKKRGRKK